MDKNKFKEVFDSYFDAIRRYIYYRCGNEEIASDIAQEVFMKVWEKRDKFSNSQIKPLLYKIASDMFISDYRKSCTRLSFSQSIQIENSNSTPIDELQYEELKQKYINTLLQIPEKQRVVFLMSRNEDLKYREIAERLNLSVKAVEKRMNAALQVLRLNLL